MRYFLLPKMDGNEIETSIQSLSFTCTLNKNRTLNITSKNASICLVE